MTQLSEAERKWVNEFLALISRTAKTAPTAVREAKGLSIASAGAIPRVVSVAPTTIQAAKHVMPPVVTTTDDLLTANAVGMGVVPDFAKHTVARRGAGGGGSASSSGSGKSAGKKQATKPAAKTNAKPAAKSNRSADALSLFCVEIEKLAYTTTFPGVATPPPRPTGDSTLDRTVQTMYALVSKPARDGSLSDEWAVEEQVALDVFARAEKEGMVERQGSPVHPSFKRSLLNAFEKARGDMKKIAAALRGHEGAVLRSAPNGSSGGGSAPSGGSGKSAGKQKAAKPAAKTNVKPAETSRRPVLVLAMFCRHIQTLAHPVILFGTAAPPPLLSGDPELDKTLKNMVGLVSQRVRDGSLTMHWAAEESAALIVLAKEEKQGLPGDENAKRSLKDQFKKARGAMEEIRAALVGKNLRAEAVINYHATVAPPGVYPDSDGNQKPKLSAAAENARKVYSGRISFEASAIVGNLVAIRSNRELSGLAAIVDERIGKTPKSPDEFLEWLGELEVEKKRTRTAILNLYVQVTGATDDIKIVWRDYENEWGGSRVAGTAEFFGGAVPLEWHEFEHVNGRHKEAIALLKADKFQSAAESARNAISSYMVVEARWNEFDEKRLKGAKRVLTGLSITKSVSFAIVSAIITGNVAGAIKIGSVATAGVGAVVTTGVEVVGSGATYLGHILAGTKEEFSVSDELINAVKSGAGQFAGGVTTSWFTGKFALQLTGHIAANLEAKLGSKASLVAANAVTLLTTQAPATVAESIITISIDAARGKTFKSTDEFLEYIGTTYLSNVGFGAVMNKFGKHFENLTKREVDAAIDAATRGTFMELPGKNPNTGEGLQDIKIKADASKPIAHHENMEFEGIAGAPNKKVEVRRHSANKNPAIKGTYSYDNPTTQVNTKKKYMLPDGTWKKFSDMTEAEKAAVHMP